MAFVSLRTIRDALDTLGEVREAVNAQGLTHLLPFLAMRRKHVDTSTEHRFEESDDFEFWDTFCRVDSNPDAPDPYADPVTRQLRIRSHPHSNVATARKGTFAGMWHAATARERSGETLWRLAPDYLEILRSKILTKGGITTRIPAWAVGAWLLRRADLRNAPFEALIARFRTEFHLTAAELDALFDLTSHTIEVAEQPIRDDEARELFGRESPAHGNLILDPAIRARAQAALESGHHLMLVGPPGTGKSALALELVSRGQRLGKCSGAEVATGTSDWSTFETFGGLLPAKDGKLQFAAGVVLRSLSNNRWLILDELNRANIDRAVGPLLTVLGARDAQVAVGLALYDEGEALRIMRVPGRPVSRRNGATFEVGDDWRLIATMNTFDRASLFPVSAALARRFATIYVGVSDPDAVLTGLQCPSPSALWGFGRQLMSEELADAPNPRPLGPAFIKDMLSYVREASAGDVSNPDVAVDAVALFALPQYIGLDRDEAGSLIEALVVGASLFVGAEMREGFLLGGKTRLTQELRRLQGL